MVFVCCLYNTPHQSKFVWRREPFCFCYIFSHTHTLTERILFKKNTLLEVWCFYIIATFVCACLVLSFSSGHVLYVYLICSLFSALSHQELLSHILIYISRGSTLTPVAKCENQQRWACCFIGSAEERAFSKRHIFSEARDTVIKIKFGARNLRHSTAWKIIADMLKGLELGICPAMNQNWFDAFIFACWQMK